MKRHSKQCVVKLVCFFSIVISTMLDGQKKAPGLVKATSGIQPLSKESSGIKEPAVPVHPQAQPQVQFVQIQPLVRAPQPQSVPAQPAQTPVTDEQLLTTILASSLPDFSSNDQNKLQLYKQLFALFTTHTNEVIMQKGIDAFLSNLVNAALVGQGISENNLEDIKTVITSVISNLATINNQLRSVTGSDSLRIIISDRLKRLQTSSTDVSKQIDKQKDFLDLLEKGQQIPLDQSINKITYYAKLLSQISPDLLDSTKLEYINDLDAMASSIKTKGGVDFKNFKKLIADAQVSPVFSSVQKQIIATVLLEKQELVANRLPLGVPAIGEAVDIVFQKKLNDVNGKKTLLEKINAGHDLLSFITAATSQSTKNNLVTFLNDLFLLQGQMNKQELVALKSLFSDVLNHALILAPNQQPIMVKWIKLLAMALELSEEQGPLLASIKNHLSKGKEPFTQMLKAAFYALNLLETRLQPVELDKRKPTSLVALLCMKLPFFYNNRANKTLEELNSIKNLFVAAKIDKDCADVLGKTWEETIDITRALMIAHTEKNMLTRLGMYQDIVKKIQASTDRYEKNILIDDLTTIFYSRKERAEIELELLRNIIIALSSSTVQKNKIFDLKSLALFNEWKKILDATDTLLKAQQTKVISQKISLIMTIIPNLTSPKMDYEKTLLISLLTEIFKARGDMKNSDLIAVKRCFIALKAQQGVLAANQVQVLLAWSKEINDALAVTTGEKTYCAALLDSAIATKNISTYVKVLDLFGAQVSTDLVNRFVVGLNTLFSQRQLYDQAAMKKLFLMVDQKKILNDAQSSVLKQWIAILKA